MIDLTFSFADLEYFLMILMRIATFVFSAPFFGMSNVPRRVKIVFAVFLSYIVYGIIPNQAVEYNSVFAYALIVIKEALCGLIIGYGANICTAILNFAGHLADMDTGLSMASLYDPITKESVTISGTIFQYSVTLIMFISGLYQFVLMAIVDSFTLIPINGAIFNTENLVLSMGKFMLDYLVIGFRICLPIFCGILLLNAVLGILAKVSPQLNMFAVGMQLKVLSGLALLLITMTLLPKISTMIMSETREIVTLLVESMT